MRLGTETGSLTNHLLSRAVIGQPEPTVGMGATILSWTDRHAGTIIKVWKERGMRLVEVQEDFAERTDSNGMSECQDYAYTPNPAGLVTTFGFFKTGWANVYLAETGRYRKSGSYGLRIGERDKHHDFSF